MSPSDQPNRAARHAVILLSGGLDSATVLAIARSEGFVCHAIAFDYGQRHRHELQAAKEVAQTVGAASFRVFPIDIGAFGGSALTDSTIDVPKDRDEDAMSSDIPITYVPARNLVFLSIALGLAETLSARHLFIGVNEIDYSGYPDCRPEFIASFQKTANLATSAGVSGDGFNIETPLIGMGKADIITRGTELGVDYGITHSCYDPAIHEDQPFACGRCDSCVLRRAGFEQAGVPDPTRYAS